jgi:hypothetical protein
VPLADRVPVPLNAPPPILIDDNELRFDADGSPVAQQPALEGFDDKLGTRKTPATSLPPGSETPDSDSSFPAQPLNATDTDGSPVDLTPGKPPTPNGVRTISYSAGPFGTAGTNISGTADNEATQYRLNAANEPIGFSAPFAPPTFPLIADIDIGTATIAESNFDSTTVLRWGRWAGGSVSVDAGAGQIETVDLGAQSLHWVSGPESGAPVMPITGTASYSLIGSTSPTDNLGNVGVLGSATFDADFTNMLVDSTLVIDINATTWSATGTGRMGAVAGLPAHLFSGSYAVTIGASLTGSGEFSGFFSEPGPASDPAIPGGVGLTYSLQDMTGSTVVSGAAVFGNP